jgi:hypothetical protein
MLEIKKKDLSVEYSNHVWQCDHTRADVLLVDRDGQILSRPWLTRVIDTYSRCIVGINFGCDAPSSQVVALALRHAILRLLSECANCGARFKIPALWANGWCHRCFLPFVEMESYQKIFECNFWDNGKHHPWQKASNEL